VVLVFSPVFLSGKSDRYPERINRLFAEKDIKNRNIRSRYLHNISLSFLSGNGAVINEFFIDGRIIEWFFKLLSVSLLAG
jgi:hypothetical protein